MSLSQYDAQPRNLRLLHHAITKRFLDPAGPLRLSLTRIFAGEPMHTLPELQEPVSLFACMPIVERIIEAGHSIVKRKTLYKHVSRSDVIASLAQRLPVTIAEIREDPQLLQTVAENVSDTQQENMPRLFGLSDHPDIKHIMTSLPAQHHKLEHPSASTPTAPKGGLLLFAKAARRAHATAKREDALQAQRALALVPSPVSR